MGISGIFKQIGPGTRVSLAKLAAEHFAKHGRPLRVAIDISIWLFQIQAGKGGSNPALRTFYYRLLRLLTLNIHPLFVFDGPNKPTFKRNKKVGGPGVRVANVPEFLAKQLLKQFGFPWHVAPGEAEAECALIQMEGIVDAVLSEDVDTLMFGSGVTLRNWTPEDKGKTPTHVNLYKSEETKTNSGMDKEGMILVALMSGGDYLPDGIPGCGPKVACDAARAGFGKSLCRLNRRDAAAIQAWKDALEYEIQTNKSKYFSRMKPSFSMPEDFPNLEVLGYYTHPCVSSEDKVSRLRTGLQFDQEIDFAALRTFTSDAFDWRCLGGAKKFIRNLAPAMLIRELRLRGESGPDDSQESQAAREKSMVSAIHGKRNHKSTDGIMEFRVSFTPADFVPIDLSIEEEDDDYRAAGRDDGESDAEAEAPLVETSDNEAPTSPTKKKRTMRPYDPMALEKLWMPRDYLKIGCPLMVETFEDCSKDPKAFFAQRQKAKAATSSKTKPGKVKKVQAVQSNTMKSYGAVTKQADSRAALKELSPTANSRSNGSGEGTKVFRVISPMQIRPDFETGISSSQPVPSVRGAKSQPRPMMASQDGSNPFAAFAKNKTKSTTETQQKQATPRRKRTSSEMESTPATQRTLDSYFSATPPSRITQKDREVFDLTEDTPPARPTTPSPISRQTAIPLRITSPMQMDPGTTPRALDLESWELPSSVTRRKKRAPLRRHQTAPAGGHEELLDDLGTHSEVVRQSATETIASRAPPTIVDLISSSPQRASMPPPAMRPLADVGRPRSRNTEQNDAEVDASAINPTSPTLRRSPRVSMIVQKKKLIQARKSMAGAWKEVDVNTEELDLTGDGSGRRAHRMSTVEVLHLDN